MRSKKAYSQINKLVGLAPLVLFLSSYMPLFILIIVRQLINNSDYLSWGGISIDASLCMIKYFGMSIVCCILIIIGWFVGTKIIFPLKPEERIPQIEGGMQKLREELYNMGKIGNDEIRSIIIFVSVLILWATDKLHGIDATTVAFIGAIVALLPGIGVVKWNDVDIPWHLMLFSAGAYALGAGLDVTGLPVMIVNSAFDTLGVTKDTPFATIFIILSGLMLFSALIFQSKTMRTLIFIPIAIGITQKFGYPILSLSFPLALLIEHVYVLPFNSKPAALLYTTNHYSWADTFKFGIVMMVIGWIMIIVWEQTVLQWLGYSPGLF